MELEDTNNIAPWLSLPSDEPGTASDEESLSRVLGLSKAQAWNLYASHFLSTWNARMYEFAVILFTASAYPETLLASSIRGISVTLAVLIFSSAIGTLIDRTPSRLKSLISTIVINRLTIMSASLLWLLITEKHDLGAGLRRRSTKFALTVVHPRIASTVLSVTGLEPFTGAKKHALFALILLLGTVERLSGLANTLSMERDWVPVLAPSTAAPESSDYNLVHLNTIMRRIDLICKLFAPLMVSFMITWSGSVRVGTLAVAGMSGASWIVEWWCAQRVWQEHASLKAPKPIPEGVEDALSTSRRNSTSTVRGLKNLFEAVGGLCATQSKQLQRYFSTPVWLPSIALALLYINVLNYAATFITYLLNIGFSLSLITLARAVSSVVEISSTLLAPWAVQTLSRSNLYYEQVHSADTGEHLGSGVPQSQLLLKYPDHSSLARLGLWGLTSQLLCLLPVTLYVLAPQGNLRQPLSTASLASPILLVFVPLTLSRLGLWLTDLSSQTLTTALVPSHAAASFAGTEQSFIAFFELLQWVAAAVWSAPEDFWKLALGSLLAIGLSAAMWAAWLRGHRGHLVHWEKFSDCVKGNS